MKLRVLYRLLCIYKVLGQYRLDEFLRGVRSVSTLRCMLRCSPFAWGHTQRSTRGERLRLALEALGPIFMKFGQALSTRRDLLPNDIADELAKLQDQVPAFSSAQARTLIETALGKSIQQAFARFEMVPLAAATIAQVHTAQLHDGTEVVVKVVRPDIRTRIECDIEVLYALARFVLRHWPEAHRLRPVEVVREYEKTILDELDLLREAGNAAQLRYNFGDSAQLYAPQVYWDYCRSNVLVMERVRGVPIGDLAELHRRGTNMQRLAENGVEIFFTQVFKHNFFHADMHPGNIFVLTDDPQQPRYAAVDFGIVGTLDPRDQYYLAENFLAFFEHDFRRIAQLHIDSGWLPAGTRVDEVESAVRTVCEPIFNKPLREISFAQVLIRLFQAAQRFNIQIQPQLILLQKTLLQVEGLGRQLYPDLDLWKTARPIMREWVRARMSPWSVLKQLRTQLPDLGEAIRTVPQLVQGILMQASEGRYRLPVEHLSAPEMQRALQLSAWRRDHTLLASGLLISTVIWFAVGAAPVWPGALCGVTAGVLLWRRSTRKPRY